jgi:hypothetical protein
MFQGVLGPFPVAVLKGKEFWPVLTITGHFSLALTWGGPGIADCVLWEVPGELGASRRPDLAYKYDD